MDDKPLFYKNKKLFFSKVDGLGKLVIDLLVCM